MRIAIDCRMSGKSGIGSYFDALLPYFVNNFECLLVGNKDCLQVFCKDGRVSAVQCEVQPFSVKELFFFSREILAMINSCDIYYSPYCNVPGGIKIPVYTTIHDIVFLDVPGLASKTGTFVRKCFYQHAVNRSEKIFTVSEFSAGRIRKKLRCRIPVVVTYNAVPEYLLNTEVGKMDKDSDSVLFVGNIKKHKGLKILLEAFAVLLKKRPSAKLIIVGNAENFRTGDASVFQEMQMLPEKSVVFTGRISNEELCRYYHKAQLLVQPSFYEGFGMPPLEALYCGTNAVISDIPVFKEIYAGFPVTFFKTGDSGNLAEKMEVALSEDRPENIPQKYSFEKTFSIIKENL